MIPGILAAQAGYPSGGEPQQDLMLTTMGASSWVISEEGTLATVAAGADPFLWHKVRAAAPKSSGKWYAEFVLQNGGAWAIGVAIAGTPTTSDVGGTANAGDGGRYQYFTTGQKRAGGVYEAYGATYTTGDVVGIALDADANTITCYKNGVNQGLMYSGLTGSYEPHLCVYGGAGTAVRVPATVAYLPAGYSTWAA